jgi:hypothetical protein
MKAKKVAETLEEGYGAGFSFTGGFSGGFRGGMGGTTRGGFGGAYNLGGPNMMYTYEIKPLNHTLEQKPNDSVDSQTETIGVGSKIKGIPVRSNVYPDGKKKVTGIVKEVIKSDNGALKYYVIQDEKTTNSIKVDPLTAELVKHDPVEYYEDRYNTAVDQPLKRAEKLKKFKKTANEHLVPESVDELLEKYDPDADKDVKGKVERSKKIPKELKEQIYPLIVNGQTRYNNGIVTRLKYSESKECDLGADKNGFFVLTHRARSKSYESVDKIPEKDIKFIESTG